MSSWSTALLTFFLLVYLFGLEVSAAPTTTFPPKSQHTGDPITDHDYPHWTHRPIPVPTRNSEVARPTPFVHNNDLPPFYNPFYNPHYNETTHKQNGDLQACLPQYNPYAPRRGLAFNNPNLIQNFCGTQILWAYNWDSARPANFPGCLEYVPMLWGNDPYHLDNFANVNNAIAHGSYRVLGFNEPDLCQPGSSCIDALTAAALYQTYMKPLIGRVYIGAPQVSNGPNGLNWMRQFLAACTGCQISMIGIHWYDAAWNVGYFQNYMNEALAIGNYGIWVTEFHGTGTIDQQKTFLSQVLPWMDQHSLISNNAWFMTDPNPNVDAPLSDPWGNPTDIGNTYRFTPHG